MNHVVPGVLLFTDKRMFTNKLLVFVMQSILQLIALPARDWLNQPAGSGFVARASNYTFRKDDCIADEGAGTSVCLSLRVLFR